MNFTYYMLLVSLIFCGCGPSVVLPNQKQGAHSPSGKYVLNLPIGPQTTNPQYQGTPVWKVTISDSTGKVLYKDNESVFIGTLNIYWGWDSKDRAWVYNSDDGRIWRWELDQGDWKKIESQKSDGIPDYVLPDYVKSKKSP